MRGNYSLIMCLQVKLKGEVVLAAALKLAVGAQLARAKSEAFKIIYLYRVGDGNQGADTANRPLEHTASSISINDIEAKIIYLCFLIIHLHSTTT